MENDGQTSKSRFVSNAYAVISYQQGDSAYEKRAARMSSLSDNIVPILCAECGAEDEISAAANKKECTSCEQKNDNDVGASFELLNDMIISDNDTAADIISTCANCGKEGSDVTNTCNKCKSVMYCNAACKKKHRTKHKKKCDRRVAELHDEKLFKQPPLEYEDCPICFLRMPSLQSGSKYKSCCGKIICCGCIHAVRIRDKRASLCPFCRTPTPTSDEEVTEMTIKRVDAGDPIAIFNLGGDYRDGTCRFPQDYTNALELYQRAGELGNSRAYCNIGFAYDRGIGADANKDQAKLYYELAAMRGSVLARHNIGSLEARAGNFDRAIKHYMISVQGGHSGSLKLLKIIYKDEGQATKEDYSKALRAYQGYLDEVKSAQRDEAAAYDDDYKYY